MHMDYLPKILNVYFLNPLAPAGLCTNELLLCNACDVS